MKAKLTFLLAIFSATLFAQTANDTIIFNPLGHYYYTGINLNSVYSPLIDRMGRPYVYTASEEVGMVTFSIGNQNQPVPVDTITPAMLNNEYASFLAQDSNYLFIATGVFQTSGQRAGLSIYDITNPLQPVLVDHWDSAAFTHGAAQVLLQGNYAYLAAMNDGVIILDISNKQDIRFVSNIVPTTNPNMLSGCHARGLYLSHDTLLVAYDGGGLRVISVVNKYNPVQIGAYLNTNASANFNRPYYNHVWRIGDQAFVALDYRGFEVDDVSNPANITTTTWNNVWNNSALGDWNGSDGHANEIAWAAPTANVLMMSGGDSQVLAIDPTNPAQGRIMGEWGVPNLDSLGSWGVDVFGNLVAIGILKTPAPFYSDSGGLQLLSWNLVLGIHEDQLQTGTLDIFPNPVSESCTIELPPSADRSFTIEVVNVMGQIIKTQTANPKMDGRTSQVDLSGIATGVYTIRVTGENLIYSERVVKE